MDYFPKYKQVCFWSPTQHVPGQVSPSVPWSPPMSPLGDNWAGTWGEIKEPTPWDQTLRLTLGDAWGGFRGRLGTFGDTWGV